MTTIFLAFNHLKLYSYIKNHVPLVWTETAADEEYLSLEEDMLVRVGKTRLTFQAPLLLDTSVMLEE